MLPPLCTTLTSLHLGALKIGQITESKLRVSFKRKRDRERERESEREIER